MQCPSRTETIDIPGNRDLTDAHRAARTREIYDVFHDTVAATLDAFARPPALVTIHSFTPAWFGQPRPTELGILHDDDPRLALAMMAAADRLAEDRSEPTLLRGRRRDPHAGAARHGARPAAT